MDPIKCYFLLKFHNTPRGKWAEKNLPPRLYVQYALEYIDAIMAYRAITKGDEAEVHKAALDRAKEKLKNLYVPW